MINVQKIKEWSYLKISIIYVMLMVTAAVFAYILLPGDSVDSEILDKIVEKIGVNVFLFICLPIMATLEEVFFRFIPIYILGKYFEKYTIPAMIIVSCLFGYLHGGWVNILLQGFGGIAFTILYIKGTTVNHPFALFLTSTVHFMHNFTICYLSY